MSSAGLTIALTTFLAAAVEAIEAVAIVTGVGAVRGWRWALLGAGAGALVLAAVVAVFGMALTAVPIGSLRLIVGALLLVFGLNWLRKGIRRVAAQGLRSRAVAEDGDVPPDGPDWVGFVLSFKGVLLEGLEVAFIVVTFGSTSNRLGAATLGALVAAIVIGIAGTAMQRVVRRIPRNVLLLVVGLLLTSFGTFWSVEGLGIDWPGSDGAILGLLLTYIAVALASIEVLRGPGQRRAARSPAA